jgi:putative membrane protein
MNSDGTISCPRNRCSFASAVGAAWLLLSVTARADGPDGLTRANWPQAWTFEPAVVAGLFFSLALYVSGLRWLRRATGEPTKFRHSALYFGAGWLLLAAALVSPLHAVGGALFSAHMVQHEILMAAAAPLLVLGRPWIIWLWALPRATARAVSTPLQGHASLRWRILRDPATAWIVHAAAIWVWHIPRYFEATLDHEWIHAAQHASFLGTAIWFWQAVIFGPLRRRGYGTSIVCLFTTALHTSALGALLTFGGHAWYPRYAASASAWGFAPLEDQQLGGIIMWVPGGLSYIVGALALFVAWMRDCERRNTVPLRPVVAGVADPGPYSIPHRTLPAFADPRLH